MKTRSSRLGVAFVFMLALGLAGATWMLAQQAAPTGRAALSQGPCDLYAAGGSPCVAAHSTTRAMYVSYSGPLYQVQRTSDNTTLDVKPLTAGGVANAAAQDAFCANTVCYITRIDDQSGLL